MLTIGGKAGKMVSRFMAQLMPDELALEYSFLGQAKKLNWSKDCENILDLMKGRLFLNHLMSKLCFLIIWYTVQLFK